MKITKNKKTTITEQQEINIGERGDFILVSGRGYYGRIGGKQYVFGKLKGIGEEDRTPPFSRRKTRSQYIDFSGNPYIPDFFEVMGIELPIFRKRSQNVVNNSRVYFRDIEEVISGLSNIIAYLENHPDKRYKGHADLIRRIAEAQRR